MRDAPQRARDLVLVLTAAPLWVPLFAFAALAVRVFEGRPVFFAQERAGKDGRAFRLFKFRTMRAGDGSDAERLTRFGRLLRRTSLDELPQLLNVLRGEMSLVGPRPLPTRYLPRYSAFAARRHEVRPGLTGLAQVSGRNALTWDEKFALDVRYVDTRTISLDLKILLKTVFCVFAARGISSGDCDTMPELPARESRASRKIDLTLLDEPLRAAVLDVADIARRAGGRAWMVGGSVRDLLSHRAVKDVDLEVFGISPDDLKRAIGARYAFDACGVSFGVLKIKHFDIDVSLPRRESKRGIGHKGFLVDADPTLTVAEAASRRDFTVNALYYDPLADVLEDPWGGVDDLAHGVLRHVSEKFSEDPLRVLRGMQFVARFGLTPADETVALCRTMGLEGLPPERLFEEWAKLLTKGVAIGRGLAFLRATGWVDHFPELKRLIGCSQDPAWHPEGDVWNHTCLCLDAFARRRTGDRDEDLIVGLAVVCHDFGKPATTRRSRGHLRSLGHDEAGVAPTLSFLRRLTNEERLLKEVPPLVQCHMQPFSLYTSKAGDAAIRRLARRVGRIDRLIRVARADDEGRGLPPDGDKVFAWLEAAAERLRVKDSVPKPILLGRHLIARGFKPSAQFGPWLEACYEAQLDGKFTDLDGALEWFDRFVR